ncbi:MAG TPA: collagen-like protein, partial [Candidatus Hydrogenedentes bacterium]|nr:collagen-like protein [Candidatus Hydrogenedentota bacterium]
MVKLHGWVVLVEQAGAQTPTVIAANAASAAPEHNGKFTIVSNMKASAVAANQPQFSNPNVVRGVTAHDAVLKAFNSYILLPSPLIPNLAGGPAPNGWCKDNYWNQAEVEAATPAGQIGDLVWWVVPSVFDGFDQLVIKNTGTSVLQEVTVKINANNRRLIRGAGYDNGFLRPGQSWTTTVPTGSTVVVNFDGEGAGADGSIYESDGHLGDLNVSGGTIVINTGAYGGAPGTMTVGGNTYEARTDVRYETGQEVAVFEFENVSVSGATVTVTGQRPLSIAARADMDWSASITVPPGTLGGGTGGNGGTGGTGGQGGTGGTGGVGGQGGTGGRGGGADLIRGTVGNGENGTPGLAGSPGTPGQPGNSGAAGGDGELGQKGFGNNGQRGQGGAGGSGGAGGTGGAGGGGGAQAAGGAGADVTVGFLAIPKNGQAGTSNPGGNAPSGSVANAPGAGQAGGAGAVGGHALYSNITSVANSLTLVAGNGGGG